MTNEIVTFIFSYKAELVVLVALACVQTLKFVWDMGFHQIVLEAKFLMTIKKTKCSV